jgi:predicted site-specific integrase-resolvase
MDNSSPFVNTADVVEATGKSVATITRWVAAGKLTPVHKSPGLRGAYLFRREDIEALAKKYKSTNPA